MRLQNKNIISRTLYQCVVVMLCSVGVAGCQRAQFPSNPFAGRLPALPVPKLLADLPKPKLPRLPRFPQLPVPNFGNLVGSGTTPSADAIASQTKSSPPPPPSQNFDTKDAEQQIAAGRVPESVKSKLAQARLAAEQSRAEITDDLSESQKQFNSALASTVSQPTSTPFLKKQPATDKTPPATKPPAGNNELWADYNPDTSPGSSNVTSGGIAELAKVNRKLYDRYGKLTTGSNSTETKVAAKSSFDFEPFKNTPDYSTEKVTSDKPDETLDGLRAQLMALKSRGSGSSSQFTLPTRSAVEIAGSAIQTPQPKPVDQPLHRGFGGASPLRLGKSQEPVSIADPTAPTNVLRASVSTPQGLVQATNIDTGFRGRNDSNGAPTGRASNTPSALPFGNSLSTQLSSADENSAMVNNNFVATKVPPTLKASAVPQTTATELPRQISDASKAALAAARAAAESQPLPQIIQQQGPLIGGITNPNFGTLPPSAAAPAFVPPTTAPIAAAPTQQIPQTQRNSAFQTPFNQPVFRQPRQVTTNQFFSRAAQDPTANAPVPSPQDSVRVADAFGSNVGSIQTPTESSTELPAAITAGDGAYAPGSVRGLNKKSLW